MLEAGTTNQQILSNYDMIQKLYAHGITNSHRNIKLFQYPSYAKNRTLHLDLHSK